MSNHSDERITATHQRWAARGFWFLFIALPTDLLVRVLLLKQEPRQYLDIALIWMAAMLYVGIGMTASGVAPFGGKRSKSWLVILIIAVGGPVELTLMGMVHTLADLIAIIISGTAGAFVMLIILRVIYGVWERKALGRGPREE
ncbi:MAG TPA: DUF6773 family protein [Armatimonadota bacterium]|nr:DUF6773 family protein [Armatimonadota bacterium]